MAWLEYAAFRGITGTLSMFPRFALRPIIGGLARIARRVDKKHTNSAKVFLRQAMGEDMSERELDERVLQAYRHLIEVTIRSPGWKRYVLADIGTSASSSSSRRSSRPCGAAARS